MGRSPCRWTAPVVSGVLLALVAGCTHTSGGHGPSAPPSLTTPSLTAQEQALAAYRGMWAAYAKAGLTANPDEPDLARYATADALATLRSGLTGYRNKNQVLKGEYVSNPRVGGGSPPATPTTVTVTDCIDDSRFLVYRSSGELVNDVPGGRRHANATVADVGAGVWKVTSFGVKAVGTC